MANPFDDDDDVAPAGKPAVKNPFDDDHPDQSPASSGIISAATSGLKKGWSDLAHVRKVGQAAPEKPVEHEDPDFAQPMKMGDITSPWLLAKKALYGVAETSPSIAGAIIGGVGGGLTGSAVAPGVGTGVGAVSGVALGAGVTSFAQALYPLWQQEAAKTPDDPDGAFNRAKKKAATEGVISGATMALFELKPFTWLVKAEIGKLGAAAMKDTVTNRAADATAKNLSQAGLKDLGLQAGAVQPGAAVAGAEIQAGQDGSDLTWEQRGDAAMAGIVGTAAPAIVHKGVTKGLEQFKKPPADATAIRSGVTGLTPDFDERTKTWAVKDEDGKIVMTGYGSAQEAATAARAQNANPEGAPAALEAPHVTAHELAFAAQRAAALYAKEKEAAGKMEPADLHPLDQAFLKNYIEGGAEYAIRTDKQAKAQIAAEQQAQAQTRNLMPDFTEGVGEFGRSESTAPPEGGAGGEHIATIADMAMPDGSIYGNQIPEQRQGPDIAAKATDIQRRLMGHVDDVVGEDGEKRPPTDLERIEAPPVTPDEIGFLDAYHRGGETAVEEYEKQIAERDARAERQRATEQLPNAAIEPNEGVGGAPPEFGPHPSEELPPGHGYGEELSKAPDLVIPEGAVHEDGELQLPPTGPDVPPEIQQRLDDIKRRMDESKRSKPGDLDPTQIEAIARARELGVDVPGFEEHQPWNAPEAPPLSWEDLALLWKYGEPVDRQKAQAQIAAPLEAPLTAANHVESFVAAAEKPASHKDIYQAVKSQGLKPGDVTNALKELVSNGTLVKDKNNRFSAPKPVVPEPPPPPFNIQGVPVNVDKKMPVHGVIPDTVGGDGLPIRTMQGPKPESTHAFVVDMIDPKTKLFDVHRVMLGYPDKASAIRAFEASISDRTGVQRTGAFNEMPVERLKEWLADGDNTRKPYNEDVKVPAVKDANKRPATIKDMDLLQAIAAEGGLNPSGDAASDVLQYLGGQNKFMPKLGAVMAAKGEGRDIDDLHTILSPRFLETIGDPQDSDGRSRFLAAIEQSAAWHLGDKKARRVWPDEIKHFKEETVSVDKGEESAARYGEYQNYLKARAQELGMKVDAINKVPTNKVIKTLGQFVHMAEGLRDRAAGLKGRAAEREKGREYDRQLEIRSLIEARSVQDEIDAFALEQMKEIEHDHAVHMDTMGEDVNRIPLYDEGVTRTLEDLEREANEQRAAENASGRGDESVEKPPGESSPEGQVDEGGGQLAGGDENRARANNAPAIDTRDLRDQAIPLGDSPLTEGAVQERNNQTEIERRAASTRPAVEQEGPAKGGLFDDQQDLLSLRKGKSSTAPITPEMYGRLRARLDKYGLGNVALRLVETINEEIANGKYSPQSPIGKLITLASDNPGGLKGMSFTLDHEAWHAIDDMKVLTDGERMAVLKEAIRTADPKLMKEYKDVYSKQGIKGKEMLARIESEIMAHWIPKAMVQEHKGAIGRILDKISNFFEALGNWSKGGDFVSAKDVVGKFQSGELGQRYRGAPGKFSRPELYSREEHDAAVNHVKADGNSTRQENPGVAVQPDPKNANLERRLPGVAGKVQEFAKAQKESFRPLMRSLQLYFTPMAAGEDKSRATAKTFANHIAESERKSADLVVRMGREFNSDQLKQMYRANDESHIAAMEQMDKGMSKAEAEQYVRDNKIGVFSLPDNQRAIMDSLNTWSEESLQAAREAGMFQGEGLPFYGTRAAVAVDEHGTFGRFKSGDKSGRIEQLINPAQGFSDRSTNLMHRKYRTLEEFHQAIKEIDPNADTVQDPRATVLALNRLQKAIAGRNLVNEIKGFSDIAGKDAYLDHKADGYFTIDNPAFYEDKPKYFTVQVDPETLKDRGYMVEDGQVLDRNGEPLSSYSVDRKGNVTKQERALYDDGRTVYESKPIFIAKEFEGPLRAVLSEGPGTLEPVYQALMKLKSTSMGMIMYSPLIHGQVVAGKAVSFAPGGIITLSLYRDGARIRKENQAFLSDATMHGARLMGSFGADRDIGDIMNREKNGASHNLIGNALGKVGDMASEQAGKNIRRLSDKFGDFWHNQLLWERVADLQAGLMKKIYDSAIKDGLDHDSAMTVAAHVGNRVVGALPMESMGQQSRKLANLLMFSRSFTVGNLGLFKDAAIGLPSDVKSWLKERVGEAKANKASTYMQRKALKALAVDVGLTYAANSLLQDAFKVMGVAAGTAGTLGGFAGAVVGKRVAGNLGAVAGAGLGSLAGASLFPNTGTETLEQAADGYARRAAHLFNGSDEKWYNLLNPFHVMNELSSTGENEPGRQHRVLFGHNSVGTAQYVRLPVGKFGEEVVDWPTNPLEMMRKKMAPLAGGSLDVLTNSDAFGRPVYDKDAKGLEGWAKNVGKVVLHIMGSQIPAGQIQDVADFVNSSKDADLAGMRVAAPIMGFTFARGYPGGEAKGILAEQTRRLEARSRETMPQVRKMVEQGRVNDARKVMMEEGFTQKQIAAAIVRYTHEGKLSAQQMNRFWREATPNEKLEMRRALAMKAQQ